MKTPVNRMLLTADKDEQTALAALDTFLKHEGGPLRIVDVHRHEAALPESLIAFLRQAAHALAQSQSIQIVPYGRDVTTQEAADLLNISRPYLIHLLDEGALPYVKVGTHRRIALEAVMAYKGRRDADRKRALDELTRLNQEMGLYNA